MATQLIRIPLTYPPIPECNNLRAYRILLPLNVEVGSGRWVQLPFRLDPGSDFTTISIADARANGIHFSTRIRVFPKTAAGKALKPSFLSPIWLLFPSLPQLWFQSHCLFSPYPLKRCLLSLNEIVPHFLVRSERATPAYPDGSIVLRLRKDHGGKQRP